MLGTKGHLPHYFLCMLILCLDHCRVRVRYGHEGKPGQGIYRDAVLFPELFVNLNLFRNKECFVLKKPFRCVYRTDVLVGIAITLRGSMSC